MSRMTRDVALMTAGTMTSRLFGLARGILLASVIGAAGLTADVFQVANTLPNTLYILVGGGILNGILVPQIVKAKLHDDGGAEFVNRIVTLTTAFLLGSTVLVTLAAPWLVHLFSDFRADALELSTTFAYICLPQMFFYGMYTLLGQILNARGLFWPYLWAPVVANLVAIVGLIWFRLAGYPLGAPISQWTPAMVAILGGTATLSIAIQAVALIIPLRRLGFRFRPVWGLRGVGLGTSSRVAMWTFAAVAVSQLGFMVQPELHSGGPRRCRGSAGRLPAGTADDRAHPDPRGGAPGCLRAGGHLLAVHRQPHLADQCRRPVGELDGSGRAALRLALPQRPHLLRP